MAKQSAPVGFQPIEVPAVDQTAHPGFTPFEVTPVPAAPSIPADSATKTAAVSVEKKEN